MQLPTGKIYIQWLSQQFYILPPFVEELLILILLEFYSQALVFSEHALLQIQPKFSIIYSLQNFPAITVKEAEFTMQAIY